METISPALFHEYLIRLDTRLSRLETGLLPGVVDVPAVTGTGAVGSTLTCTTGNWTAMSAEPHSYAYQWQSDGSPLPGGSLATYVVVEDDAGHNLACVVTATNPLGSTRAIPSNAVAVPVVVPEAAAAPAARRTAEHAR